jgi:radical SAM superfamily enzyme YgiQ (UPF0313 family)
MSSRGCPYDCIYCHRIFGKRFRAFSAERIVSEIEHWHQTYQLKDIEFIDDIFNLNPRRVLDFSELMQRRSERFRLAFPNALRCDILTRETVDALVAAGTYYSSCAIDTASPRLQTFIGKHLNIPRCLDAIKMLAERKVLTHGYSMIGFPTETEEEIELTIDTVCGSELHTASFFIAIPYPKTRMYELAAQMYPEKLSALNHCDADFRSAEANFSAVPDDAFFRYQRQAWRRFYLNPSRIFRILRAYPNPFYIATYMPLLLLGIGKGFFRLKQIM